MRSKINLPKNKCNFLIAKAHKGIKKECNGIRYGLAFGVSLSLNSEVGVNQLSLATETHFYICAKKLWLDFLGFG